MLKAKNQHNFIKIVILAVFLTASFLAISHSASHNFTDLEKEIPGAISPANQIDVDCDLCLLANGFSSIASFAALAFFLSYFLLNFSLRKFCRVKASYLLSSNLSRAPPFNS